MHPTTSYQIATLQAAELQRRADLRATQVPVRRARVRHGIPSVGRPSLARARTLLAMLRGA